MRSPTLEEAFVSAVVDGINIYIREAILDKGLLNSELSGQLDLKEALDLKHEIAQEIARKWARLDCFKEP